MPKKNTLYAIIPAFTVCCFFTALTTVAQSTVWQKSFNEGDIFSSPRCEDLNNDGTKDIIIGAGVEFGTSQNGILALDGFNGSVLWFRPVFDNVFSSAVFTDLNQDGKKDVVLGGRLANLQAIDGQNGQLIWEFYHCNDFLTCRNDTLLNFYTPVVIPDINHDGINELVVTYGGFRLAAAADTVRPHGYLMVMDGATGDSLIALQTPDGRETYCSPVITDIDDDGEKEVLFGTGGETIGGSLWMIALNDLTQGNPGFLQLASASKGFIAPVSITDMNGDQIFDIVAMSFDGSIFVINGSDRSVLQQRNFPGHESANQPCLGYFNADSVPDIGVILNEGIFPVYTSCRKYLIDGSTFQDIYSKEEGSFSYYSMLAVNTNGDAIDEVLITNHYKDASLIDQFSIYTYNPLTQDSVNYFHSPGSFGIASTPTWNDIDNNGSFDLIFSHSLRSQQVQRQFFITRINTGVNASKAASWSEYMGTKANNTLDNRQQANPHSFTEVSQQIGVDHISLSLRSIFIHGGVAWFDYDNDGFVDLYVTGGMIGDKLYHNDGHGNFVDVTVQAGLGGMVGKETNGVVTGDIDNDGFRDLVVLTSKHFTNFLFKNNGDGTFTDISVSAGFTDMAESASASFGDYNKDGFIDLFIGNGVVNYTNTAPVPFYKTYPNNFYLNNGNGTFTDVGGAMGVADTISSTLGATFSDYDLDGDVDLFLANEFGSHHNNPNQLLRNDYPLNSFTDVSVQSGMNIPMDGMGAAAGDYDGDGDLDYYATNIGRDILMKNNGNGTFTNVINATGLARDHAMLIIPHGGGMFNVPKLTWGCGFFDYDNDSHLDLFTVGGNYVFDYNTLDTNKLFHSNGDGTFTDVSAIAQVEDMYHGRGFAYADYDNDGDLDMVVAVQDTLIGNHHTLLYRNNLPARTWVKFNLVGVQSNRDAFGAKVFLKTGNRTLLREVDGGSSFASHHASAIHYGLQNTTAENGVIDSLIILWPSGIVDRFADIVPNKTYIINEGGAITEWIPAIAPATALITGDSIACAGTPLVFAASANGATSFVWSFPAAWQIDSLGATVSVTPDTASGFVSVYGENLYGTGNSDSMYVTINRKPEIISSISGDAELCLGDSSAFSVQTSTNTDSVVWQHPASWSVSYSGNSINVSYADTSGILEATAVNECGLGSNKMLQVNVHDFPDKPTITPGTDLIICEGNSVALTASNEFSYLWNTGHTTQSITVSDSGLFAVSAISQFGCLKTSDTIRVSFVPLPQIATFTLSHDTLFVLSDSVLFYRWYRGSTPVDSTTQPFLVVKQNGVYSVEVENASGCLNYSEALPVILPGVFVLGSNELRVYPSPVSDNLIVAFSQPEQVKLAIYDMAGKPLIEKSFTEMKLAVSVKELPQGIYYLHITSGNDRHFAVTSFVKM